jgi:hypothetical protein
MTAMPETASGIDLYWLPLGAGGHSVRWNGRIFEWVAARLDRRDRCDLYHSALEVRLPDGRFVIEQAPAWSEGGDRGVVAEGAVGSRALGRLTLSATRFGCGATVSFQTWRRPSTVHNSLLTIPTARGAS